MVLIRTAAYLVGLLLGVYIRKKYTNKRKMVEYGPLISRNIVRMHYLNGIYQKSDVDCARMCRLPSFLVRILEWMVKVINQNNYHLSKSTRRRMAVIRNW